MTNAQNETLRETLFEQFLDEGFSETEVEKLANERFFEESNAATSRADISKRLRAPFGYRGPPPCS